MLPRHTATSIGLVALFAIVAPAASTDAFGLSATYASAPTPQREALVLTRIADAGGAPIEGVEVRLIRCRGPRRFTIVPSFTPANPSGVPVDPDRSNCDVVQKTTDEEGLAKFHGVAVGDNYTAAGRDSTLSYLIRTNKEGFTNVRQRITPHVAVNEVDLVVYRTAGERMFELIDEAEAAVANGDFAAAEGAMIQSVAMMSAEVSVRGMETPEVLLETVRYLAYIQLAGGSYLVASETLNELLALAPDDTYGLRTSGSIAVRARDWVLARRHFGEYLRLNPDSSDANFLMGSLSLEVGEVDAAAQLLETAVEFDPSFAPAFRSLAMAHEQLGNLADAVRCFTSYLQLAGEPPDAPHIRATIAMLQRNS